MKAVTALEAGVPGTALHPTLGQRGPKKTTPPRSLRANSVGHRWLIAGAAVLLLHLAHVLTGNAASPSLWCAPLGLGVVLVAWFGWRGVFLVALDAVLSALNDPLSNGVGSAGAWWGAILEPAEVALAWWCYHHLAGGKRRLSDPSSAALFLLLVPGAIAALFAWLALVPLARTVPVLELWPMVRAVWLAHALGLLGFAPALLVVGTPWLLRWRLIATEERAEERGLESFAPFELGDWIESAGLSVGAISLVLCLVLAPSFWEMPGWQLWGVPLLLIVWASLRRGLGGGLVTASVVAVISATVASSLAWPEHRQLLLQGNLLAQCSTALLVGVSAHWIRSGEARYRQVVGNIPVVLYSARILRPSAGGRAPEAEITFVSPASRDLLGCPPARLIGDFYGWMEHIHARDREVVLAGLTQLALQEEPVTCEYRLACTEPRRTVPPGVGQAAPWIIAPAHPAAPERWVRETMTPHLNAQGELEGWEGVLTDITLQRQLADDLRRTTNMFHALVANLPAGVFFIQGNAGRPILVNARARQLLGQREDPAAGLEHLAEVYRLHRPDGTPYPTEELPVVEALRRGVTTMRDDIVVHRPDGKITPLVTWAAPIDLGGQGRPDAAVWVLEDLTSLHTAERARRESEGRLRAVIATMAEGLIVQDENGAILECNPAASTILGLSPDQLRGRSLFDPAWRYLAEDGSPFPAEQHPARLSLSTGEPVRNVILGVLVGGAADAHNAVRWILMNAMPLLRSGSKQARVVTTFTDVTEQRRAMQDLQRAQRQELVGRLASGIAHDFNNLLTVVLTLTELAKQHVPAQHPVRDDLRRIGETADQAVSLASQLLAFGKQRRPNTQPVDVNWVVGRTLELLRRTLPSSIEVTADLERAALHVLADETQLQQVLMNLCLNARDAMPDGGQLLVQTQAVAQGPDEGETARTSNGWVRLTVRDEGQGMPEQVKERIFDPFFSTKERGTGLGLAVVHQIVEACGGRVEVWSEPGQGSRFDIWLPRIGI